MKIGIEAQRIMRKKKHGMDMVALNLLALLPVVAPQHEYVLFTKNGDDTELPDRLNGIKIVHVPALTYVDWEQIALPIAINNEGVDIMHFTGNTAPLFCPVPYVLTLHDVIFLESRASNTKSLYQQLGFYYRKMIVPVVARKASKVVTVSNFECKRIQKYIPEVTEVSYIYNAIESNFGNKPDSEIVLSKLPEQYMFFLGNTDPKKNTSRVIDAYVQYRKKFKGNLSLVVGDFNQTLLKNILKKNDALDLLPEIITLGYLANYDLPTVYRNATCFLYPSLRESFGIPILEAMACGCPVITSNTSSMPEVSGAAALLINPYDVNEISLAMLTMEFSYQERNRQIELGIVQEKKFSWYKSAEQYTQLFHEASHNSFATTTMTKRSYQE